MSNIEWTDKSWNCWWGCGEIAPECGKHAPTGTTGICYAALFASRSLHPQFRGVAAGGKWTGKLMPAPPAMWEEPLHWCKPRRIFTMSMTDVFHEGAPLEWLAAVLDMMDRCPQHTFQMLTKRPAVGRRKLAELKRGLPKNAWLGVTCGHMQSLPVLRVLREMEASRKFISCEPLLTPLASRLSLNGIHWMIVGGQSGPSAARCDADEVRALRDLAVSRGVPLFFKQWGTWSSNPTPRAAELDPDAKGGATLDGVLWREFPA